MDGQLRQFCYRRQGFVTDMGVPDRGAGSQGPWAAAELPPVHT